MTVKFDEIDKTLDKMSEEQLKLTLQTIAVRVMHLEVVDKFDYVECVKIGLSWPPEEK